MRLDRVSVPAFGRLTLLLCFVGATSVGLHAEPAEGTVMPLVLTARQYDSFQPWKEGRVETRRGLCFFVSERGVVCRVDARLLVQAWIESNLGREELRVIRVDSDLGLLYGELHQQGGAKAKDRYIFPHIPWKQASDAPRLHEPLALLGLRLDQGRTANLAYYKGITSYTLKSGISFPVIEFTGWEKENADRGLLLYNGKLLGLVLAFSEEQNLGIALPVSLLNSFVKGALQRDATEILIEDNGPYGSVHYPLFMHCGFNYEPVSDPLLKSHLGIGLDSEGVYVTSVWGKAGTEEFFLPGDAIVAVNGKRILPGGQIEDAVFGQLPLRALFAMKDGLPFAPGASVQVDILRKGVARRELVRLLPITTDRLRIPSGDTRPAYYFSAGGLFTELTAQYIHALPDGEAKERFSFLQTCCAVAEAGDVYRYVVLQRIYPLKGNEGYRAEDRIVYAVNGIAVRDLRHLRDLIENAVENGRFVAVQLDDKSQIVLDAASVRQMQEEFRKDYGIPFLTNLPPRSVP